MPTMAFAELCVPAYAVNCGQCHLGVRGRGRRAAIFRWLRSCPVAEPAGVAIVQSARAARGADPRLRASPSTAFSIAALDEIVEAFR
jgi:hypothetical protein